MKNKFKLDFFQAMKIVMDGGWVKGENFVNGVFMKLNDHGQLVIVDANRMYDEDTSVFLKNMDKQMFREVRIATVKELMD